MVLATRLKYFSFIASCWTWIIHLRRDVGGISYQNNLNNLNTYKKKLILNFVLTAFPNDSMNRLFTIEKKSSLSDFPGTFCLKYETTRGNFFNVGDSWLQLNNRKRIYPSCGNADSKTWWNKTAKTALPQTARAILQHREKEGPRKARFFTRAAKSVWLPASH